MTVTDWQVVREKGKQPDNREQLVGSVTPATPARVSPETKQLMRTLTLCHNHHHQPEDEGNENASSKKLQVVKTSTLNDRKSANETFLNLSCTRNASDRPIALTPC